MQRFDGTVRSYLLIMSLFYHSDLVDGEFGLSRSEVAVTAKTISNRLQVLIQDQCCIPNAVA